MSERQEKVVSLLTELTASFIQQEANHDPMITVTKVTTSPDLKRATIHITTLPEGKEEAALVFLKRYGRELRNYVKKRSKLKHIPHFDFSLDHGERHRQHIDEISRRIEQDK